MRKILLKIFLRAMDDDFNTPKVLAALHEFRGEVNKLLVKGIIRRSQGSGIQNIRWLGMVIGFFQIPADRMAI